MDNIHILVKSSFNQKAAIAFGLILLALALLLGLAIVQIDFSLPALAFPVFLAVPGSIVLISLPRARQREIHRQAAARGEPTLLATVQPIPYEAALPITIKIGPNVVWLLIFYTLLIPPLMVLAGIGALLQGNYSLDLSQHGILSGLPLFFAQSAGLAAFFFLVSILGERERIEASSEGLLLSKGAAPARTEQVPWEQVLLLAIRRGKEQAEATEYELSGPTTIVRWRRLHQKRWFSWVKPALPFDEYDRQMEALLSLIAAKTGLPLYDLRG